MPCGEDGLQGYLNEKGYFESAVKTGRQELNTVRRIAKNTLVLFLAQIISMGAGVFHSRRGSTEFSKEKGVTGYWPMDAIKKDSV